MNNPPPYSGAGVGSKLTSKQENTMTTDKTDNRKLTQTLKVADGVMVTIDPNAPAHFVHWEHVKKCNSCSKDFVHYVTMAKKVSEKWSTCYECFSKNQYTKRFSKLPEQVQAVINKARGN